MQIRYKGFLHKKQCPSKMEELVVQQDQRVPTHADLHKDVWVSRQAGREYKYTSHTVYRHVSYLVLPPWSLDRKTSVTLRELTDH